MKRLSSILLVLLFVGSVFGQENIIRLRGFTGLNTIDGDFSIKPTEARVAHNIDLGRNVGAITKRYGYDSISTISGMDSILNNGIYGAYNSDGTQYLAIACDSNGVGYGGLYITADGSSNIGSLTKIKNYWSVQGEPSWTMFGDNLYVVNGMNRGIVWNGDVVRDFPMRAPGEPTIVPLVDSGGLDGQYRYVIYYFGDTTTFWGGSPKINSGYITSPFMVRNGRAMLTNFPYINVDSVYQYIGYTSFKYYIYRTLGDYNNITLTTKIYPIDSFVVGDADSAYDYIFIDSLYDTTLTNRSPTKEAFAIDADMVGKDSSGSGRRRYSAPGYISTNSYITYDTGTAGNDTANFGLFYGIPKQNDTLGVGYMCTFIDTVTGIESDSGRSMFIWVYKDSSKTGKQKPYSVTATLPKIPAGDSGIVINLYRCHILQITYDSTRWGPLVDDNGDTLWWGRETEFANRQNLKVWVEKRAVDTVITSSYYLVEQFSSTDTIFTDSLRFDSVSTRRIFSKSTPPSILDNIFSYQGRLYGTRGSRIWRSSLLNSLQDTIQYWGQMTFQSVNEDDGDAITIAYPTRTAVRVLKNFSNYNIYDDFSKTEISGYFGCIAPHSHASGIGGHYYLSNQGILRESDGANLERTFDIQNVSVKLDNFDKLSITTKQKAHSFYYDKKYMLSIGDTTYVYDERADGWATWGLAFGSATLYGTETSVGFIPGDTMYFVKPGDSTLLRYGTSEYDNYKSKSDSTNIPFYWYTPPLLIDESLKNIVGLGLWVNSSDTGESVYFTLYDEEGVSGGTVTFDDLTDRYKIKSASINIGQYFRFLCSTGLVNENLSTTIIDGIDIYYIRQSLTPEKE